jgi:hypothetical protein
MINKIITKTMKVVFLLLALASVAHADDCCQFYLNHTHVTSSPCVSNTTECNATQVVATQVTSSCNASYELVCCEYENVTYALTVETCCSSVVANGMCDYGNETIVWTPPPTTGDSGDDSGGSSSSSKGLGAGWILLILVGALLLVLICTCVMYAISKKD